MTEDPHVRQRQVLLITEERLN